MQPAEFAAKWRALSQHASERAAYQEHFRDLCALIGQPTPSSDTSGQDYAFEKHVKKVGTDDPGYADVFLRGRFIAEYKARGKSLGKALQQATLYARDLGNPPLLMVSDLERIELHTNFTGTSPRALRLGLDDIARDAPLAGSDLTALQALRALFRDPDALDPRRQRERVTEQATERVGRVAQGLAARGVPADRAAHFLMRAVFSMFAEDAGILPAGTFEGLLGSARQYPEQSELLFRGLFGAMRAGGFFGSAHIRAFNGGLFDSEDALALTRDELGALHAAAELDWTEVEPAIFGTLFEDSLDAATRGRRGAHYTAVPDILRVVAPVVLDPLRREWAGVRDRAAALADKRGGPKLALEQIQAFHARLAGVTVLDPACGSGNFLYVTLKQLLDLEHEVRLTAFGLGAGDFDFPPRVHPRQLRGIEIEAFASELAGVTLWIGYFQWKRAHGGDWPDPVLERLDNISHHDALLNEDGSKYEWPEAEFIVGNPPFLGGKVMRSGLGDAYVNSLFAAFDGRVARESDLVCYWFEKARAQIAAGHTTRAGLVTTNSIRGGANRKVLQRIQESGAIFAAWDDEPWAQDGAAVRVSFVCFDDGREPSRHLDGLPVTQINADLTASVDVTGARPLRENAGISFMGTTKGGPFDIAGEVARAWLALPNPNGRPNSDVVKPWVNGLDLTRRPRDMWIIDFALMTEAEASEYLTPFEYVRAKVKPEREQGRDEIGKQTWWRHLRSRPDMRAAFQGLNRYICTPRVAKHRVFVWLAMETIPDSAVIAIARDDDFTLGVLQSRMHEAWALVQGTALEDRPRYTPSTCFETFPFPHPTPEARAEVEKWSKYLVQVRGHLLGQDARATLTGLYNRAAALRAAPDPADPVAALVTAHDRLDAAVAAAYGWPWPLDEAEVLGRLLALNLERSG